MNSKCKKEMTYFILGLGSIFTWAVVMWVSLIILRVDESIAYGIGLSVIPTIVFASYCFIKAEGDTRYIRQPDIPMPSRIRYNKEDEIIRKKQREKMFNNNYEMYKNAYESINQIKEM